jgi:hypothetical protein
MRNSGFPAGAVSGHARQLCYGSLYGKKVLIFQGRAHYYESGDACGDARAARPADRLRLAAADPDQCGGLAAARHAARAASP